MRAYFKYYGRSRFGKIKIGKIHAKGRRDAMETLLRKYKSVYLLEPIGRGSIGKIFAPRISIPEKIIFVKNMHVLLKAGVTLDGALKIVHNQGSSANMKKIARRLYDDVRSGNSFASALRYYDMVFNPLFINLVYVGEKSGTLDDNLNYLATELEHTLDLRRKIRGAAFYPAIILFALLTMGVIMVIFVLPQLTTVFDSIRIELPLVTRIFIRISNFLQNYTLLTLGAAITGFILFRMLLLRRLIRLIWIRLLMSLPLFGQLIRSYNLALINRTLGILLKAGLPIIEALDITAQVTNNIYYKLAVARGKERVSQGVQLGDSLPVKQFTPLVVQLIKTGEQSGSLETNLLYLSDFYNNKIDYITKNLPVVLEPALLIAVGIAVAFVAFATLSPIYEFTGSVGRIK